MTLLMVASGGSGGSSPLGNASVLRLFRLARLARMARMLRSMPELLILIKGMASAMRSVGFVLLLLLIMMYVFSIAFVLLLKGQPVGASHFPGIPTAMYTLLVSGTFMDNITVVANEIGRDSMICAGLFFFFVGLSALTVMNMLIGVLCEVVSSVAECEKEGMLVAYVTEKFKEIWASMDEDGTGQLSKKEFMTIMSNKEAWLALEEVDVDPMALVNLADQIFEPDIDTGEEPNLTLDEFMDVILAFRGKNTATVKDMNDLRKWMSGQLHKQAADMARFIEQTQGFMRDSRMSSTRLSSNRVSSGSIQR